MLSTLVYVTVNVNMVDGDPVVGETDPDVRTGGVASTKIFRIE
jgi:hypothetical protein